MTDMLKTMMCATLVMLASQSLSAGEETSEQTLEAYRITVSYETESKSDTGSGSSSGRNSYIERILQDGPDGIVREYDVFLEPGQERHLSDWQYPFRVRQSGSDAELLDRDEMIARRNAWLAAAEIPMESCGRHVFTWNVFRIECYPDHVVELLETVQI